jgi:Tol biopolymer transport system component
MGNPTNQGHGSSAGASPSERLESWKEIAAYLKRNERTARRWEKTEALPVYRHTHARRDSVYAYKAELDAWWGSRRFGLDGKDSAASLRAKDSWHALFPWIGAIVGIMAFAGVALWHSDPTSVGLSEPLKIVPLTSYPGYERYASFSPDGSQVAFSWKEEARDKFHIYTKPIGSSAPVRRTTHATDDLSPAWSPDGRFIAFHRTLSAEKTEIILIPAPGGPERPLTVISRADSAPSSLILFGHDVAWSPDSKFLIVAGRGSPEERFGLLLISIETGAKRGLLSPAPKSGIYLAPSLSPDGRHLAFVRRTDFVVSEIWVSTLSQDLTPQGEPRRMTYANRLTTSPVWAADGREIMFLSGELGAEARLYRMSISGPGKPKVMPSLGEGAALLSLLQPSGAGAPFIPQPGRLAYTRAIKDHNICRIESNRVTGRFSPPHPFISSTRVDFNPQFSPDGRRIAFESTRSGSMEIWVANADGSNPTQLTDFGGPLTSAARWSPDSQQIVFNSRFGGQADLYIISVSGGKPQRLTHEPSTEELPSWSRDGRWLYFKSDRNGSNQVWKMPVRGGEPIQVTKNGGLAALESADGKFVYYSKGRALGPASLWRVSGSKYGAAGDETQVLESLADWSTFCVVAHGIYYIPYAEGGTDGSIQFHAFTNGKSREIAAIKKPVAVGLSVSPDGLTILYTQVDREDNDLMLVETMR